MRVSPRKVRVNYFCFARSQPIQTTNGRLTRSIGRASLDKAKKEMMIQEIPRPAEAAA